MPNPGLELPSPEPPPDRTLESAEEVQRIESATAALPPDQRKALVAHHFDGSPVAAIAAQACTTVAAIESRLCRARARLAELLEFPLPPARRPAR